MPKRIEGCVLINSSEVHINLSGFEIILTNRDDFIAIFDSSGFIKTTKSEGYISVEEINVIISGIIQPKFIIPSLQYGSDLEGSFRRLLV